MSAGGKPSGPIKGVPFLDSRHDYVNHMDPFDGPLRILHLATCGKPTGDEFALGEAVDWTTEDAGPVCGFGAKVYSVGEEELPLAGVGMIEIR